VFDDEFKSASVQPRVSTYKGSLCLGGIIDSISWKQLAALLLSQNSVNAALK
jgi:hypothetical protein